MAKPDEVGKAAERGQELTPAEEALEDARDAFHGNKEDPSTKEAFKAAQEAVRAERLADRQARESQVPPADANNVIRDANGKIFGWTTAAGDAVSALGGRAG
jgi:hypothetical protein